MYSQGRQRVKVCWDLASVMLIFFTFIIMVYSATYVDYNLPLAVKSELVLIMFFGGLFLSMPSEMGVGWVLDKSINPAEVAKGAAGTFVSVVAIFIVNIVTADLVGLSTIGVSGILFSQVVGIAEEVAIRGYVLNFIDNITYGNTIVAILGSSFFGAIWHAAIYGARDARIIIVVFLCFVVLGWVYAFGQEEVDGQRARRLSVTMLGHVIVNTAAGMRSVRVAAATLINIVRSKKI